MTSGSSDARPSDVFDAGPRPAGLRYCFGSVALRFVEAPQAAA
ncbi:MAG TPA: hypothetical protein VIH11_04395 [Gemmatimonadaceae bacterium]|nr:hypothetical protein [Gemmatimonadaceae bacterium]